ncbi:hypothetical protein D5S18_15895 [Nocardia panacis]|uniref:Uncharacterized protein n=1 Tax=Nocardia panacis TaxID=2340916 RepID=A0A3A4KZE7_9NOCA|nr:hypothetical protein [Nocardia panacis]RJO74897.1 hypothetical protein D5S18_15895 [Nocardia panacis]
MKTDPENATVIVEAPCRDQMCTSRGFVPVIDGRLAPHSNLLGNPCEWAGVGIVDDRETAGMRQWPTTDQAGRVIWSLDSYLRRLEFMGVMRR